MEIGGDLCDCAAALRCRCALQAGLDQAFLLVDRLQMF
jgi:hypothetical protein